MMDFDRSEIGKVLSYLIPAIMFILFNILFRKQKEQQRRLAVVKSLLPEINYNHRLAESFSLRSQTKKFKTNTWKRNKDKMDYIDQSLYSALVDAYGIADEFNKKIDMAKKYKSPSYLVVLNTERLIKSLAKGRQGLEEWIELNKGKEKTTSG